MNEKKRFNRGGKLHPKCEQYIPMNWGPRLIEKEKMN